MTKGWRRGRAVSGGAASLAALIAGGPAAADPPAPPEAALVFHGALTYGTSIRTRDRDPALIPTGNGAAIGISTSAPAGRNSDDGNLNFAKYDALSTVLKGVGSVEVKRGEGGALLRVKFWDDFALSDENRPWGNNPNAYAAGRPLGQDGLSQRAKFTGLVVQDAYLHDTVSLAGKTLYARIGQQNIEWGRGWRIQGGLSSLTPLDLPAINRPGALPEESTVPFPALFSRFEATENARLEAFYQLVYRPSELNACGTFFSAQDYSATGCNRILLAGANDRTGLAAGLYGKRAPTPDVRNGGQYGLGAVYRMPAIASEVGAYATKYHSRWMYTGAVKTTRLSGSPFLPGDPDGRNAQYIVEYPEDVRLFALTWRTALDGLTLAGELAHSPNQPVQINSTDLLNAFSSSTAPSLLRGDAAATAAGAVYHGYDRLRVTQLLVSATRTWPEALGGRRLALGAEAGLKVATNLPDPAVRRYGRSDIYGPGAVNGVCAGSSIQCSFDGYVTRSAWGYRLWAGITWPAVVSGLDLAPGIAYASDVRGWSYDGVFNEGRKTARLSLKATLRRLYSAELAWNPTWGGTYNNMRDRSYLSATVGLRF